MAHAQLRPVSMQTITMLTNQTVPMHTAQSEKDLSFLLSSMHKASFLMVGHFNYTNIKPNNNSIGFLSLCFK